MVTAGFEATVAPLGTALTEDQLALLWKMADEPTCASTAMAPAGAPPTARSISRCRGSSPARACKFAILPEGQDPGRPRALRGRGGVARGARRARGPLADMLWTRETEAGAFDTPERRAALEARVGQIADSIGDETVRKYYRQDLENRLRGLFRPERASAELRPFQRGARGQGGRPWQQRGFGKPAQTLAPLSPRLSTPAPSCAARSAHSRRARR